jgi:hypothetical protein
MFFCFNVQKKTNIGRLKNDFGRQDFFLLKKNGHKIRNFIEEKKSLGH